MTKEKLLPLLLFSIIIADFPDLCLSSYSFCNYGIIGGGISGLTTTYELSKKFGAQVCLFEKSSNLGGRIKDVDLVTGKTINIKADLPGVRVCLTEREMAIKSKWPETFE